METRRRNTLARLRGGSPRPQIVLLHVPKCGGTSVKAGIKSCVGSKRSGLRVKISYKNVDTLLGEREAMRARAAQFVYGRFSWDTLQQVRRNEETFAFTMLRNPESRLMSLYNFFKRHPANYRANFDNPIFDMASAMTPTEFFGCADPTILFHFHNAVVRQFSGNPISKFPSAETEWQAALDSAKANLASLSYIAFTETIDQDLEEILRQVNLPKIAVTPRLNAAADPNAASIDTVESDPQQARQLRALLEPLLRWDRELYEFASSDACNARTLANLSQSIGSKVQMAKILPLQHHGAGAF